METLFEEKLKVLTGSQEEYLRVYRTNLSKAEVVDFSQNPSKRPRVQLVDGSILRPVDQSLVQLL